MRKTTGKGYDNVSYNTKLYEINHNVSVQSSAKTCINSVVTSQAPVRIALKKKTPKKK